MKIKPFFAECTLEGGNSQGIDVSFETYFKNPNEEAVRIFNKRIKDAFEELSKTHNPSRAPTLEEHEAIVAEMGHGQTNEIARLAFEQTVEKSK